MLLTLDVGNSQIFGGIFDGDKLKLTFRKSTEAKASADELGLFLKGVLRESKIELASIDGIALCSVVPELTHPLRNCCLRYFQREPFVLGPGSRTGVRLRVKEPSEMGADRVANALAAVERHPGKNIIIVGMGTANTICVVDKNKDYLGGLILPGLRISMEALAEKTAKLPSVEIAKPKELVGKTTVANIQAGLFYGALGALKHIIQTIKDEEFKSEGAVVIGTGGFSRLFADEGIFDEVVPDLILQGLFLASQANR